MSEQPSGLLARWNLRRQKVQQEEQAEQLSEQESQVEASAPTTDRANEVSAAEPTEEKVLTAEDLPDPEKIEVGGSFASFMAENVDPDAKNAALRALWKQPHYSEIDGLLEYALDYTNQPKLSAEVSAELAKKVFRHLVKDDEQAQPEIEEMTVSVEQDIENIADESGSDILDATGSELPQNEQEVQVAPKPPVA
ncbi:DUF3306 domain-containing protein [Shewanella psychrotolerans]|uniref:DUF3306 domain-containing protein n=1 Tax=Shewanella psychrotolerans TaxID=2864206 RepID=UPI001C660316|nr:DUF3306 domain-containing protein [Shewanella psychrotolerans]QYK01473.1 DUF3306 domain-containing protein [Shewanella psychrotolerans]